MLLEHWMAGAVMAALTLYALAGGADFGGGVWDLLARGPRAAAQREVIAHAIGPIWEANHVWLILALVLLFVCFPLVFAVLCTALHVPLTVMLLGIVLRGSAFAFRSYDRESDRVQRRWGRLFASASLLTPLTLGICVGAIASGAIRVRDGRVLTGFFEGWLHGFPAAVGMLTVALFAFLAAVYLTWETADPELQEDFRRRALGSGVAVGVLALGSLAVARYGAPLVYAGLVDRPWSLPFHLSTAAVAVGALAALAWRRFGWARALAVTQAVLVLWGWAAAQFPYAVVPDLTFTGTAAPPNVLRIALVALVMGALVLFPSLVYLFRIFKRA
jgi:cytochrome bd ubiquinol oxidase subunit II